jgi:O-antigen/teichoic acid export membrane protein
VIIMQLYRPLSEVGYYIVAQTVAELVLMLAQEFRWTSMVLVTKYEGDVRQAATTADAIRHYGILAVVVAVGDAVFGSLLIVLAYGKSYTSAIVPMLILLPGIWFLGMGIVVQGDLSGRGRPGLSSALAGVAAVVSVALDFLLIPPFGVIGAAVASVCSYATFGVLSIIALKRLSGISVRELLVPKHEDFVNYRRFLIRTAAGLGRAVRSSGRRGER